MSTRAKFTVQSVEISKDGATVKMTPVTSGSEENKAFFKYTPSGLITMGLVEVAGATDYFKPGRAFYVDFEPAE